MSPLRQPPAANPLPVLLSRLIDYAGLFPPAGLPMAEAVRNHADCLSGPQSAALGRFVLPINRLPEFEAEYAKLPESARLGWRLNVLAGPDPVADRATIADFNHRHPHARIIGVEAKATTTAEIMVLVQGYQTTTEMWIEIPPDEDPRPLLQVIRLAGRKAKIRTGGTSPGAFPSSAQVARFLRTCLALNLVCKATAGLHHALRGEYPLTYEPNSSRSTMFGFLNIFLAAALVRAGGTETEIIDLLEERSAAAFQALPDAITWRDHRFTANNLRVTRQQLCRSFGSCSFTEPLAELFSLHWQ